MTSTLNGRLSREQQEHSRKYVNTAEQGVRDAVGEDIEVAEQVRATVLAFRRSTRLNGRPSA